MQSITPSQLEQSLEAGEPYLLLDVREREELDICRIDGAVHIPMSEIPARLHELDPDSRIVCICHHGLRSASVAGFLVARDFADVLNLTGGVERWATEVDPAMPRY
jgi:rhodanese-related sulfurtransferase